MCPVKVKESLLDHASVGRILSCGEHDIQPNYPGDYM